MLHSNFRRSEETIADAYLSLDNEYFPVDKIQLYSPKKKSKRVTDEEPLPDFSITSDYEIRILEYTADHKPKGESIYTIDPTHMFQKGE